MSEYGCWNHESTGFIFSGSSKMSNLFYILTEGDAVIKWNEHCKGFQRPRNVSFHLFQNNDIGANDEIDNIMPSEEIARFSAVKCTVHPKYLKDKLADYNIAIITINDRENKLEKINPFKLCDSSKNHKHYNKAIVFGFAGIWDHELFGMKGDVKCLDGKTINFKNIIARGSGGPILCYEEKSDDNIDMKVDVEYTKMRELLNMGLDIDSALSFDCKKNFNMKDIYDAIFVKSKYNPSKEDREIYNKQDNDYQDIFGCLNRDVTGLSLGENGLLLTEELLKWIKCNTE
eukprot:70446_1